MYALVDCDSFFCSVEKVFHPGLSGKPVCVLSCNDGCIVALTPEARELGLRRGDPVFRHRDVVDKHGVFIFSNNLSLYAAMSKRVMSILRDSVPVVEEYSIDESFCNLSGLGSDRDIERHMREVAERIRLWTDIPVSVGIAASKTLAKVGGRFAKKYKAYRSVCMIDSEEKRRKALSMTELSDIWGMGRRTCARLAGLGVKTPLQFSDRSEAWVLHHFSKPVWQTWCELNGRPCIAAGETAGNRTITTSRTFGNMVTSLADLRSAVASFASSCAGKLRAQHSVAGRVTVFISSNPFREDLIPYRDFSSADLTVPSSDTIEITGAALGVLDTLYRPDVMYKRAGVILGCTGPDSSVQLELFDKVKLRYERGELSHTVDTLNRRFGFRKVRLAVEDDGSSAWKSVCGHRSGDYLTDIDGILSVSI